METYFANDGSYGDASGIVIIDTDKWTEFEWGLFEHVSDYLRTELAEDIRDWHDGYVLSEDSLLGMVLKEHYSEVLPEIVPPWLDSVV